MKRFAGWILLGWLALPSGVIAQSPEQIHYQAVARDAESGGELINQDVLVVFKVRNAGPNGAILYQEMHEAETNAFGLVNLVIGAGDVMEGSFETINWGDGTRWLEVEMDLGEGFEAVSNTQFVSVPYALFADLAATAVDVDDDDPDPTNELIDPENTFLDDTLLVITEGGITHIINLAGLANFGPWQVGSGTVFNTEANIGIGTDEPHSNLHTQGSVAGTIRVENAGLSPILLTESDHMLVVDVSLTPGVVVLPPAASCEGRIYYIKRFKSFNTTNTLEIAPSPGDLIDGSNFSIPLNSLTGLETRMLVSAGSAGWFVMSE